MLWRGILILSTIEIIKTTNLPKPQNAEEYCNDGRTHINPKRELKVTRQRYTGLNLLKTANKQAFVDFSPPRYMEDISVCGTDVKTYNSYYELEIAQLVQPYLKFLHPGPCVLESADFNVRSARRNTVVMTVKPKNSIKKKDSPNYSWNLDDDSGVSGAPERQNTDRDPSGPGAPSGTAVLSHAPRDLNSTKKPKTQDGSNIAKTTWWPLGPGIGASVDSSFSSGAPSFASKSLRQGSGGPGGWKDGNNDPRGWGGGHDGSDSRGSLTIYSGAPGREDMTDVFVRPGRSWGTGGDLTGTPGGGTRLPGRPVGREVIPSRSDAPAGGWRANGGVQDWPGSSAWGWGTADSVSGRHESPGVGRGVPWAPNSPKFYWGGGGGSPSSTGEKGGGYDFQGRPNVSSGRGRGTVGVWGGNSGGRWAGDNGGLGEGQGGVDPDNIGGLPGAPGTLVSGGKGRPDPSGGGRGGDKESSVKFGGNRPTTKGPKGIGRSDLSNQIGNFNKFAGDIYGFVKDALEYLGYMPKE